MLEVLEWRVVSLGRAGVRQDVGSLVKKRIVVSLRKDRSTAVSRATVGAVQEMIRLAVLVESPTVPCWLSEKPRYPATSSWRLGTAFCICPAS